MSGRRMKRVSHPRPKAEALPEPVNGDGQASLDGAPAPAGGFTPKRPAPRVEVPENEAPALAPSPYLENGGRLCQRKMTQEGKLNFVPLANFTAQIVGEVVRDDGAEKQTFLSVEGRLDTGRALERIEVPSSQFAGLGWIISQWGPGAVVFAGNGIKDHLRVALQLLSESPPRRVIYGHTGWRQIEDRWCYLHTGGAIGAEGPVPGIEVDPGGKLQGFALPNPPEGEALREAIHASLGLLSVATDEVAVPLFLACYRAPLGPSPFGIHIAGRTGNGKSVIQGLAQAHWGMGFDHQSIPGNWQSTKTALEVLTFAAKDAVLCVDDFAPDGSKQDQARLQGVMAHLFRTVGNGSSRDRCTDSATLRPSRSPRGLVISSGEDLPAGHSIRARVLILETEPGMMKWDEVTKLQTQAKTGALASAMAGYLRWLAPQVGALPRGLSDRLGELRGMFQASHKRTTDQAVQLLMGGEFFLRFAQAVGALNESQARSLEARFRKALGTVAESQTEAQAASDPVRRFLSGRAHLEGTADRKPEHAERLGWSRQTGAPPDELYPKGRCIGWEDAGKGLLYLEPAACYAEVQLFAGSEGDSLPVTKGTLWKRLREKGLIEIEEANRYPKKVPGRGQGHRGIALRASAIGIQKSPGVFGEVA
jgi:hypothetical protein